MTIAFVGRTNDERRSVRKEPKMPYYDRITRNERGLRAVRRYIRNNPARRAEDRELPK